MIPFAQPGGADGFGDPVNVFQTTGVNGGNSGDENVSYRHLIPVTLDSRKQIRVTFGSAGGSPFSVKNCSIGLPQTAPAAIGVPTELLFDGKSGFTALAAGLQITSDWVNFGNFKAGDKVLVTIDIAATNGNACAYTATGATFYFKVASSTYNVAAFASGGSSANLCDGVVSIEVR